MTIESDIKTVLDADSGLTALIATRSYASKLPQSPTYPNISYSRVDTIPSLTLNGRNKRTSARFQFEVRGSTYESVRAVVQALIDALEAQTTFVVLFQTDSDIPFEDEVQVYRTDVDFIFWYDEA